MIRFIAAVDNKLGMADDHGIPWDLPSDRKYFRDKTLHGNVMMGSGWYKEQELPLPDRRNLVATKDPTPLRPGFERVTDAREYLQNTKDDIWVGGGAGLFASTIDLAEELYLTHIDADFQCTKFFPEFEKDFKLVSKSKPLTENGIEYYFAIYRRN
jgi:dihydrofolate reductase